MLVVVKKKNGTRIKGVKCGSEGGLLYLANPYEQVGDEADTGFDEGFMESPIGKAVEGDGGCTRFILIPIADIDVIESAGC